MAGDNGDPADEKNSEAQTQREALILSADGKPELQDGSTRLFPVALTKYMVSCGSEPPALALDMAKCNIKPLLLGSVCEYVALLNTPLVRLSLSNNPVGPRGAMLLGKALITNNTLQFLELNQCELIGSVYRPQYEGVMALAKGFESVRSTLRSISLADNALQPEGCRILLGALSFHTTLTALDISSNLLASFSEKQGYFALTYLIQYAKQLSSLTIDDNMLPPASWRVLQSSLAGNSTLTSLSAERCGVTIEQLHLPASTKQ